MEGNSLDILAFGAHSDDVEIGMAGTIAKYTKAGRRVGICDLTEAEMSSNGTVELRRQEAERAASILGVSVRENLQIPDRGIFVNEEYIRKVVTIIRKYKPSIVFVPYHQDRHPDHGNCAKLVEEAFFSAGIKNSTDLIGLPPHRPKFLYYYMINGFHKPTFVIDISETIGEKVKSLQAYESQFQRKVDSVDTPLVNGYIEAIGDRERMFGREMGITYAEGFISQKPLTINKDLLGD